MKKASKSMIVILLALLMAVMNPLTSFASGTASYISDVVTYSASSYKEAKEGLEALGYTAVKDSNVNSTLGTGVYLGYKTTTDPDEAITDLAVMNMNGPYSYTDYEEILESEREAIRDELDDLLPAIRAFQDSYNEGKVSGQIVYAALNQYYDEDTGEGMGDLLLNYSENDEDQLTEIFLQGSSAIILNIIQTLALTAGNADDTNVLETMAELGVDGVFNAYLVTNRNNAKKATEAINRDLGNAVVAIESNWDALYETLSETKQYVAIDGEDVIVTIPEVDSDGGITEGLTSADILENVNLYLNLFYTVIDEEEGEDGEVKEVTALDYFMRPMKDCDLTDLYLVAYCLTDAQTGLLTYLSLARLLSFDSYCLDDGSEESAEVLKSYTEGDLLAISVYEGIDRTYFEKGVAFTSEATKHESLYGEEWSPESTSTCWLYSVLATSALAVACIGVGAGVLNYIKKATTEAALAAAETTMALEDACNETTKIYQKTLEVASAPGEFIRATREAYAKAGKFITQETELITDYVTSEMYSSYRTWEEALLEADDYAAAGLLDQQNALLEQEKRLDALNGYRAKGVGIGFKVFACVMFALAIVFAVLDILSIISYFATKAAEEANVPVHIVTAETDGDGREDYVYYSVVENQLGEAADLNNHEAPTSTGWLVLYYTKDPLAGNPITADALTVQTGSSSVPEDSFGIHMFNEEAPINLTDETYTGVTDSAKGTYVFFERGTSLAVGSAISQGVAFIYAGAGLVVGVLVGTLASGKARKKKVQTA